MIFIISLLTIKSGINIYKFQYLYKKQKSVLNSSVYVSIKDDLKESGGSGIIIKNDDKFYVLTNAHVCLSSNFNHIKENISKNKISYEFYNEKNNIKLSTTVKNLIYSIEYDTCLIPISKSKFSYNIEKEPFFMPKAHKNLKYFSYQTSYGKSKKLNKFTGKIKRKIFNQSFSYIDFKNKKRRKFFKLKKGSIIDAPVISGQSGSPVFDSNWNLISLIMGNQKNLWGKINHGYTTDTEMLAYILNLENK